MSKAPKISCLFGAAAVLAAVVVPAASAAGPKVGRLVVVGDSLSAGFENFSLYDTAQQQGYPALIAKQAGVKLTLPLISQPGIPPMLELKPDGSIVRADSIGGRENPGDQPFNLSVPAFTLANAFAYTASSPTTNPIDALAATILGQPACGVVGGTPQAPIVSEITCALRLQPDTIIVSLGNNDALQSLTFGVPPTDVNTFRVQYSLLIAALRSTGARLVLGNVPDVSSLPFLVPVPVVQAICGAIPPGAGPTDYVVPDITSPNPSICTSNQVRSAVLISQTRAAIVAYNNTIASFGVMPNVAVADVNALFANAAAHGYTIGTDTLTTQFLGGLFSLDAIHPTATGQGILANLFIDAMDAKFNMKIPHVDLLAIEQADPLAHIPHP